jgi:mannan endo-1,4-beta-mannosidase
MWCLVFWLHVEGFNTPTFDADGFVTGLDTLGTMISDMREFLDVAQSHNIIVIFSLFNGAVMKNKNVINLFLNDAKLDSYIQNALKVCCTIKFLN